MENKTINIHNQNKLNFGEKKTMFTLGEQQICVVNNLDDLQLKKLELKSNEVLGLGSHFVRTAKPGLNKIYSTYHNTMFLLNKQENEEQLLVSIDEALKSDFVDGAAI